MALGSEHALPHIPQCEALELVSTHALEQSVVPAGHPDTHRPIAASQSGAAPLHATPHAPQFAAVPSGTSQPLSAIRSQSPKPATHPLTVQAPREQAATAAASEQSLPHEPQWLGSELGSTHAAPHRMVPAGHEGASTGATSAVLSGLPSLD